MINVRQFRSEVIRPALVHLDMWSVAAENLVLGTALQESNLSYLKQIEGPALGLFQIEPATHIDVWKNFLSYRPTLSARVDELIAHSPPIEGQLVSNMMYAAAICRLVYYRRPEPLPAANDIDGLAEYWKAHYNTPLGRGTAAEWSLKYREHVSG